MRPIPTQKISKNALKVCRITGFFGTVLIGLAPLSYFFLVKYFLFPIWLFWLLLFVVLLIGFVNVIIIPTLHWQRWSYEVYENEIDLLYGIFIVRRVLIPMIRVQHVDTTQGPLLRKYGLATVTITTAATVHEIPALSEERAASIRDQISQLATEAYEDV